MAAAACTTPAIASPMLRPTSQMMLRRSTLPPASVSARAERVAEREVAQVADVQGLGRVGVPEVERVAPAGGDVGIRSVAASPGVERLPRSARPSRRRGAARPACRSRSTASTQGSRLDLLQRRERGGVLLPAVDPRHQHQVEALVRAGRAPAAPRAAAPLPPVAISSKWSKRLVAIAGHGSTSIGNAPAGARTRISGF